MVLDDIFGSIIVIDNETHKGLDDNLYAGIDMSDNETIVINQKQALEMVKHLIKIFDLDTNEKA